MMGLSRFRGVGNQAANGPHEAQLVGATVTGKDESIAPINVARPAPAQLREPEVEVRILAPEPPTRRRSGGLPVTSPRTTKTKQKGRDFAFIGVIGLALFLIWGLPVIGYLILGETPAVILVQVVGVISALIILAYHHASHIGEARCGIGHAENRRRSGIDGEVVALLSGVSRK